jgi:hypothetical protein
MEAAAKNNQEQLSEEERKEIIERAQRELPDLDKKFEQAVDNLERISEGLRPRHAA